MTALSCVVLILPFLPGIVMSDGMKSLALLSAVWAILLSIILPALDELIIASEGRINTEILTQ
jgi:hypothetical protein